VIRAAVVALALLLAACGGGPERDIERAVEQAVASGGEVDLVAATGGGWDRVGIFGPYTTAAQIEATLGIPAPARAEGMLGSDGVQLLLFARDERVVSAAYLGRDVADLAHLSPVALPAEAARLAVTPSGGAPRLDPAG
jgi:hypothetical protein